MLQNARQVTLSAAGSVLLLGSGCAVGPRYERPITEQSQSFAAAAEWKAATPSDHLPRGAWWQVYDDAVLDDLMQKVSISNQNVLQAEAQFRAARALVQSARAAFFPTLDADASVTRGEGSRSRFSTVTIPGGTSGTGGSAGTGGAGGGTGAGGIPTGGTTTTTVPTTISRGVQTSYSASLDASWELDLWGRVRRQVENARATAAASEADLQSVVLSARAELAQDYFQLRITDAQIALLQDEIQGFERSLKITRNQYAAGVVARSDVLQAQTQLDSTRAQLLDARISRAQYEHAIAVLIGKHPSSFSLAAAELRASIPATPLGLPADLLERRPDVAAAERRVMAANAQVGVARAAFFPSLSLGGNFGYENSQFSNLVAAANRTWSIGPSLVLPLFRGGALRAASRQAEANYDAAVAAYRQTTLAAIQDVEDNLVTLERLEESNAVQSSAAKAARDVETITLNQYQAGTVSYLNVVVAQSTALTNARNSLQIRGRQLVASVGLIRALGGGWQAGSIAQAVRSDSGRPP